MPNSLLGLLQSVPNRRRFLFSPLIALLLLTGGCAKIGDPQPPEILVPKAAVDLMAHQVADAIRLQVSRPLLNTNGSAVTTLRSVEVYRHAVDRSAAQNSARMPSDRFQHEKELILSIPAERLSEYEEQNSLVFKDTLSELETSLIYTQTFCYGVLFVNDKNQAAGFSNLAVINPVRLPHPPTGLRADITETSIRLVWEVPETGEGQESGWTLKYNVYRSTERQQVTEFPVNPEPLQKPEYNDVHFDFGRTYYYRVSVVAGLQSPSAEGLPSKEIAVTPRDIFPPLPVDNFIANFEDDYVLLLWNQSPSSDIAGYVIAKRENGSAAEQALQQEPIKANSFRDRNVQPGRQYIYTIKAIDTSGNESTVVEAETAK